MSTPEPPVSGSSSEEPRRSAPLAKGDPSLRGLPSLARARKERRPSSSAIWNWLGPLVALVLLVWWRVDAARQAELRDGLLTRQREVAARLGPKWLPLREKVERWTTECAAANFQEVPHPGLAASWDFRSQPGIYLRLAKKNAETPEAIRKAAQLSLHDGFSSCLFTPPTNPNPVTGAVCENTQDCASGEQCNEFNRCAAPSQPYNWRLAYRATHVLSDEWLSEIQTTRGELALRGAVSSFDAIEKYDLPIATDLLSKATYLLVVVDEPVEGGEVAEGAGGGGAFVEDRSIPTGPHQARVCLFRVADGDKVLAIRREASGELKGGKPQADEVRLARQRQANSCALALEVRQAIEATPSP